MAASRIAPEGFDILYGSGSEWVQVNVPHQRQQISLLFAQDGFVPVLKQHAVSSVSTVELLGVTGQKPAHNGTYGHTPRPQKHMDVVVHQRPCQAGGAGLDQKPAKAREEILAVGIIPEDRRTVDPPYDDMVEGAWSVDAGFAGHEDRINTQAQYCQLFTIVPFLRFCLTGMGAVFYRA
jgi:hypothetical protein